MPVPDLRYLATAAAMLTSWLITTFSPLFWRTPAARARRLWGFASAEAASELDLIDAARKTPCPERKRRYLLHALDESRHAAAFAKRARRLARQAEIELPPLLVDTDEPYERLGETGFLALLSRGERRGRVRFEALLPVLRKRDATTHRLIRAIVADERRHEHDAQTMLSLVAGEAGAGRARRRVLVWEAWRNARRRGRAMVAPLTAALFGLLYVLMAPLALYVRRVLPERAGLNPPRKPSPAELPKATSKPAARSSS